MIDLKSISKAFATLKGEEARLKAQRETCLQRREDLHTLPLPKEDFIAVLHELLDSNEDPLPQILRQQLDGWLHNPMDIPNYGGKFMPLSWPNSATITGQLLHTLFKTEIKTAVAAAVNQWDWPQEVGPTRKERKKEIAKLDNEIETLNQQIEELASLQAA